MRKTLVTLGLVLVMVLAVVLMSGCEQVRAGKVVAMTHHYAWAEPYTHHITHHHSQTTGSGKNKRTISWNTYEDKPAYHFHPAYWQIQIASDDNDKGEMRYATWFITEAEYKQLKIGDWFEVSDSASGYEPQYDRDAEDVSASELAQFKIMSYYVEEKK